MAERIYLQEQHNEKEIRLLPAWPKDWDVEFKLHAPYKTVVAGTSISGKVTRLNVTPRERQNDIIMMDNNQ